MITKRTLNCTVAHPETGLTMNIFRVDCFAEVFYTEDSSPEFEFHERYYETEAGQLALYHKPGVWIVRTDINQWFVVEK